LERIAVDQSAYIAEIERWREQMEAGLRADDGWLTLAGLFWLHEGLNSFGADSMSDIVLPAGTAPRHAGAFELRDGVVTLRAADGVGVTLNDDDAPVDSVRLRSDADGGPDRVRLGPLTLLIIRRGARTGVRVKDAQSPVRAAFGGRRWYAPDEAYRIQAAFVPYDPPRRLPVANILGDLDDLPSPGYALFRLEGQDYRLDALPDPNGLAFYFYDATSGRTTYPAGRYLKTALPQDDQLTLDFNRAYSPPCAFTAFATCTLPPPQNRLPVPIEAGELYDRTLASAH
jgi:uncharacterized protein (DUF1684 family)